MKNLYLDLMIFPSQTSHRGESHARNSHSATMPDTRWGNRTMRKAFTMPVLFIFAAAMLSLAGCELTQNQLKVDRAANMEVQDFRDALAPRDPELPSESESGDDIPPLMSYVAPVSDDLRPMPLVSISVNQTVPLRDVFYELAAQADYDIELDPRIQGSVIFTARNRPFDVVVDRIADMAGLRYKFKDDMLRVELDTPYLKTYKIDYLNMIRTTSGEISNNIAVVSGDGADTGSNFSAGNEGVADFWLELSENLTQILGVSREAGQLRTSADPRITAVEQDAPVAATAPAVEGENGEGAAPAAPSAVLRVDSLPVDGAPVGEGAGDVSASFSVNKQAGIVNVYATQEQHREVQDYLETLRTSVSSQVLIEAKVLEVSLNDEFATGIDWNTAFFGGELGLGLEVDGRTNLGLDLDVDGVFEQLPNVVPVLEPNVAPGASFFLGYSGSDVNAFVEAISRFGTVRALASPRLTVQNNQAAVLNVATNVVYFEIDVDQTNDEGVVTTEIDSEIKNVPEGVLINVQPSINSDSNKISLAVRPTITRIVNFKSDPAVASFGVGVENLIPELNVQEIDSVIKMSSGQMVIMGGLMQDRYESGQNAVPILGETPILGGLFRSQRDEIRKTELVIFLKATIVDDALADPTDKDLYRTFAQDRRPSRL